MKFALSVLAVLGLVGSLNARALRIKIPGVGKGELATEMQGFMDLVPVHEVMTILRAYAAQDKEFRTVMKLVDSDETVLYIKEIEAHPMAKELMNYVQNAGLDIYLIVNKLNAALQIEPITPFASHKITGGLRGLMVDLAAVIPIKQMEDLMERKIEQSPVFSAFIDEVLARKYMDLYELIYSSEHVEKVAQQAKAVGIDTEIIKLNYMYWIAARQVLKLRL